MQADTAFEPNPTVPTLFLGIADDRQRSSVPAVVRRALAADQPVWLLQADGRATPTTLDTIPVDGFSAIFVPAVDAESAERSLAGLRQIVHRLRAPGGCPW